MSDTPKSRAEKLRAAQIEKVRAYTGPDEIMSSLELRAYFQAQEAEEPDFKFQSGFPRIDRICDGFQAGELITVSGPTKCGKTLFCQSVTVNVCNAADVAPPLWFSYEVPPKQFLASFPKGVVPLFYLPKTLYAASIEWFEERCLESWEKNRTRIVFIDHLHFLFDQFKIKNPSLEIGAIVRRLKRFAVDFGFVFFLCAHIHKIPQGERPRHGHVRDSSFIAQESDAVFMLWRTRESTGSIENSAALSVEFHRRTGVMDQVVELTKQQGLLFEREFQNA